MPDSKIVSIDGVFSVETTTVRCKICDATLTTKTDWRERHVKEHIRELEYLKEKIDKIISVLGETTQNKENSAK